MSEKEQRSLRDPIALRRRDREVTETHPLPTRRCGEILPPGASRRGRWSTAATAIPAWVIFGLIWWRAIAEQPDQLAVGAIIWGACALLTAVVIIAWVAWNRGLAHRRERRYGGRSGAPEGKIAYGHDALGRQVVISDGAPTARHLTADVVDGTKRIGIVAD